MIRQPDTRGVGGDTPEIAGADPAASRREPGASGELARTGIASRVMDVTIASVGLVACLPVIAGAALAIRLDGDRGPLLYHARRVGEGGRQFSALKLRTMRSDAGGSRVTVADDPRVTRVGRVLRRYRVDELPQLFNVLRGDMSMVGPRPEDERYVDMTDPVHRFVFTARPGITGPTQLAFRDEAELMTGPDPELVYRTEILPAKVAMDADYLRRRTIWTDLAILARTVGMLIPRMAGPS